MKLRLKKDITELNNLSSDERLKYKNVYDLFLIEIPKDDCYIEIDTNMQLIINEVLIDCLYNILHEDHYYRLDDYYDYGIISHYFLNKKNIINFKNWRNRNKNLNIEYLNYEDDYIISLVILNYLIFNDLKIYDRFYCTNIENFLGTILKVINNDHMQSMIGLDDITIFI